MISRPKSIGEAWRKMIQMDSDIERLTAENSRLQKAYGRKFNTVTKLLNALEVIADGSSCEIDFLIETASNAIEDAAVSSQQESTDD